MPSHARLRAPLSSSNGARLACLLALGCSAGAAPAPQASAATPRAGSPEFDAARAWQLLLDQVALGPRPAGTPAAEKNRALIERELSAAGLQPRREVFTANTPAGPLTMANVVAELSASGADAATAPCILVCSHFDTKRAAFPFVGANDGASSTAVLLELARAMAAAPRGPVTWRFAFFDGEEAVRSFWADPDNRYGSRHHAQELKRTGEAARVRFCVLLDLIGDRDLKLARDSNSSRVLRDVFFETAKQLGLEQHLGGVEEPISDDHLSMIEIGIESIDLIDFDYGPDNRFWHTAEDTPDKCSADSLGVIGRLVLGARPRLEALAMQAKRP